MRCSWAMASRWARGPSRYVYNYTTSIRILLVYEWVCGHIHTQGPHIYVRPHTGSMQAKRATRDFTRNFTRGLILVVCSLNARRATRAGATYSVRIDRRIYTLGVSLVLNRMCVRIPLVHKWPHRCSMQAKRATRDAVGRHIFPLESLGIITCAFLAHPSEVLS